MDQHLGKNYLRVRIGIDHPGQRDLVERHVLGQISDQEYEIFEQMMSEISNHADLLTTPLAVQHFSQKLVAYHQHLSQYHQTV
ncbi:MAG: hypothetical protein AAF403_01490 [Pseudomonadota bacterium]